MSMSAAKTLKGSEKMDVLMETVEERYNQINKDAEVTLIEGLVPTRKHPLLTKRTRRSPTLSVQKLCSLPPGY